MSTSTGLLTIPVTGFYQINIRNNVYNVSVDNFFRHGLIVNGTGYSTDQALIFTWTDISKNNATQTISSSDCRKYTAGDTLRPYARVEESGLLSAGRDYANFNGFLVTAT